MSDETISDDQWAAKVAAATSRPAPEDYVTLHSPAAQRATVAASLEEGAVRRRVLAKLQEQKLSGDGLVDAVDDDPEVRAAAEKHAAAKQAEIDAEITFHLRGLPPKAYDDLQLQHPATDEQERRGMLWNESTFFPALLSACSVRPLTVEQATAILEAGNAGDKASFMMTLRRLNEHGHLSLGKGSGSTSS